MLKNDLHIHSISSGHAYSTISEILKYASENNMDVIAITDHGPSMEGAPHAGYFENMVRLPKEIEGVLFLKSCEANILNTEGDIDISFDIQEKLDFVMAGIHNRTSYPRNNNPRENTSAIINAIHKNKIKVISHPVRPEFPVIIGEVVEACAKNHVAMEINLDTLKVNQANNEFLSATKELLKETVKHNGVLIISSDAHFITEVGDDSILTKIKIELPSENLLLTEEQIIRFIQSGN